MENKRTNLNTFLIAIASLGLGAGLTVVGRIAERAYDKMQFVSDAILVMQNKMVTSEKFDASIADIKTRQSSTEARQTASDIRITQLEVEIQNLKNRKP